VASFPGVCAAREPGIHTPNAVAMGSGLAASDLGLHEIGTIRCHIGSNRCAMAPRNE